jgi:hypothetical protein
MPTASELIAQALGERQKYNQLSSPTYMAGQSLLASKPNYNTGNAWTDALLGGAQAALGGGLQGYGYKSAEADTADWSNGLASALGGSDPYGTMLKDPTYAELGGALQGVDFQNQNAMDLALKRDLASSLMRDGNVTGEGSNIGLAVDANGRLKFVQKESPVTARVDSQIGTVQDPEMQAYSIGVQQARQLGVPRTQQGVFGQKRAEFVRGQMKTAQDEALKSRQEADKLLGDAQQLKTLSDVVGDNYTGISGQASYKLNSVLNSTDPVFNNAKEITGLGMAGIRNLRSDSQISENERRALLQALPSGTQPAQFNQDIANKWAQTAVIKNTYANWLEDAAAQGIPASQARRAWSTARQGVDMFGTDPKTGALAVADPNVWRQTIEQRLYGAPQTPAGGNVVMPQSVGGITAIAPQGGTQAQTGGIPAPLPGETKEQWKARIRGL